MALINGNEYDHIDFTKNGVTTRHPFKDTVSRQMSSDLVKVQNEEPTSEGTKIWIKPSGDSEVQVPTYEEFEELSDKIDDADATIESLAVGAQPTVSITDVDGHKRFSFGIPASNGIASITKTATDGVIDTYTIAMTDGTSTSFSVNNSDITPESMAEAIATALQDYARIDGYYPDLTSGNADQLNSTKFVENEEPYLYRPSGGSADIGNREYVDAVVGGTLVWNQAVRDETSENSTDFADVVTVTDAVEDAAGVRVKLEPVQDLHGYDHPWPAGGGANKWPVSDMSFTLYSTSLSKTDYPEIYAAMEKLTPGANYRCWSTGTGENVLVAINLYYSDRTIAIRPANMTGGDIPDLSDGTITLNVVQMQVGTATNVSKECHEIRVIETTTSNPAYVPYENICPISGHTGMTVTRTGKNLFNKNAIAEPSTDESIPITASTSIEVVKQQIKQGYQIFRGTHPAAEAFTIQGTNEIYAFIPCKPGATYIMNAYNVGSTYCVDDALNILSNISIDDSRRPFVTPEGCAYLACYISNTAWRPDGGTGRQTFTIPEALANLMVSVGSIATDYEPYQGITIPISWETEAGTVYGGELDVTTGVLTVAWVSVTFDENFPVGAANWRPFSGFSAWLYKKTDLSGIKNTSDGLGVIISDTLPSLDYSGVFNGSIGISGVPSDSWGVCVRVPVEGLNTVALIREYLREHPIHAVYSLATPVTYTLTASQITTLLGTNNVWADTGDLALTYTGTNEHLTLESGKKYLAHISGTDSMLLGSAQEITAAKGTDNVFDLTKMFGTSVADYIYNQGAGYFRQWFGKTWYPYNTGELKHVEGLESHDLVGFNIWDEEWEVGNISATGENETNTMMIRSKNYVPVIENTAYYFTNPRISTGSLATMLYYDADRNFISSAAVVAASPAFTTPSGARYLRFVMVYTYGTIYKNDICIHFTHNGSRNGEYEPYEKHSYSLDNTVILRGVPIVDANGVYWDGDRYLPDGTVERRYGVVDLGTLNYASNTGIAHAYWTTLQNGLIIENEQIPSQLTNGYKSVSASRMSANDKCYRVYGTFSYGGFCRLMIKNTEWQDTNDAKAALSGVYLVYPITPTTEQALSYRNFQLVDDWGTEEFVTTGMIPVGHESRYPANLRDKLQHLPDAASSNGSYLITQTDGQMTLTPFPAPPTTAGKYALRATVTNGVATFTWEATT